MRTAVWRMFRGLAGLESGRWCRSCGESVAGADAFGMGEGVCPPCRAFATSEVPDTTS